MRRLVAVGVESDVTIGVDAAHDDSFQIKLRTEKTRECFSRLLLLCDREAFLRAVRVL